MLLDDPSPLVRQAMAEVFARSAEAPAAIVQALSLDQPSVALPVLEHSPLLIDADLVDIVATGNCEMQCAIARRINLPASVCAAIAEVGTRGGSARADRKRLCRTGAVFLGPHRRAPRPSRRDPGIDAGAGRSAGGDAGGAGRQTLRHAGAIRRRPELAERRSRRADRQRGARSLDRQHRGALARRRHARPGAASARHRPTHRRTDPARAAVGQSRTVRCTRWRNCPACRWPASPRCCTTAAAPACRRC